LTRKIDSKAIAWYEEEGMLEDTKGVTRNHNWKNDRQYNGQKEGQTTEW
jgi:hypothetical protein